MSRIPTLSMQQRRAAQDLYGASNWVQTDLAKLFAVSRSSVQRAVVGLKAPQGASHGLSSYAHGKCRCAFCKNEWRSYHRDYRERAVSEGETL